jgi:hypothetical protein
MLEPARKGCRARRRPLRRLCRAPRRFGSPSRFLLAPSYKPFDFAFGVLRGGNLTLIRLFIARKTRQNSVLLIKRDLKLYLFSFDLRL